MATLGKKLTMALADRGWSASELARRVGVSATTGSRWVNGSRVPSLPEAWRIAAALGCTVDWLADPAADWPHDRVAPYRPLGGGYLAPHPPPGGVPSSAGEPDRHDPAAKR